MAEKKKSFTEQHLKDMGLVEVKPNMYVKAIAPFLHNEDPSVSQVKKFVTSLEVPRNGKYGVADVQDRSTGGRKYDSKLEMKYRQHLDLLALAGEVIRIEEQVPYELMVSGQKICVYVLDFRVTYKDGSKKWIDVKGMATSVYRIKKKLFEAIFNPITITEIKAGDF